MMTRKQLFEAIEAENNKAIVAMEQVKRMEEIERIRNEIEKRDCFGSKEIISGSQDFLLRMNAIIAYARCNIREYQSRLKDTDFMSMFKVIDGYNANIVYFGDSLDDAKVACKFYHARNDGYFLPILIELKDEDVVNRTIPFGFA